MKTLLIFLILIISNLNNLKAESIKICRPNNLVSAYSFIAEEQGFYKEQGLEVEFDAPTNAKICQDAMLAGQVDLSFMADGPISYAAAFNPPLKIIAMTERYEDLSLFVSNKSGINNFNDIKGKRIGYLPGTVSFFYLARILEKYKIQKSDIKLVPLQAQAMPIALQGAAVDGYIIWEPWGDNGLKLINNQGKKISDPGLYPEVGVVLGRTDFINENSAAIKKFLKALAQSDNYIKNNPDAVAENIRGHAKFSKELYQAVMPYHTYNLELDAEYACKIITENIRLLKIYDKAFSNLPDFNCPNIISRVFRAK